jgi:hypothetical protein
LPAQSSQKKSQNYNNITPSFVDLFFEEDPIEKDESLIQSQNATFIRARTMYSAIKQSEAAKTEAQKQLSAQTQATNAGAAKSQTGFFSTSKESAGAAGKGGERREGWLWRD